MSEAYKKLIYKYGRKPNRKYGQNFLINESCLDKIIRFSGKIKSKEILEVGPGLGFLTEKILQRSPKSLTSIEIDQNLIGLLQEKFASYNNFKLVNQDALGVNEENLQLSKITVIANLPYNISVPLIMKWIDKIQEFDGFYLLVQKEVAKRIIAKSGKSYGTVSVIINYMADSEILFDVPPSYFFPPPKVDSSFIKITPKKDVQKRIESLKSLQEICKVIFTNRRKMVRNTLPKISGEWAEALQESDIADTSRPEEISISQYVKLASILGKYQ